MVLTKSTREMVDIVATTTLPAEYYYWKSEYNQCKEI